MLRARHWPDSSAMRGHTRVRTTGTLDQILRVSTYFVVEPLAIPLRQLFVNNSIQFIDWHFGQTFQMKQ